MLSIEQARKLKSGGFVARDLVDLGLFANVNYAYEAMRAGKIKYSTYGKCGKLVAKKQIIDYLKQQINEVIIELKLTNENFKYLQRQVELEEQDGYVMSIDNCVNTMCDYFKGQNFFISNKREAA